MADTQASLGKLEQTFDLYFRQKAPALPKNVKDIIVSLAPWLTLIFLILALPAVFLLFGLATVLAPFGFLSQGASYANSLVGTLILIVAVVFEGLSIPGLFARSKKGWRFAYWAALISAVSSLANFAIGSALIGLVVSLYFLFQVKEYYK